MYKPTPNIQTYSQIYESTFSHSNILPNIQPNIPTNMLPNMQLTVQSIIGSNIKQSDSLYKQTTKHTIKLLNAQYYANSSHVYLHVRCSQPLNSCLGILLLSISVTSDNCKVLIFNC